MNMSREENLKCGVKRMPVLCAIIIFLFVLLNYIDRSIIAFTAGDISSQFHISHTSFGVLVSSFFFGAMVSNLVSGVLCDRYDNKYIWLLAGVIWSVALIGQSMVHSEHAFMLMRVLTGFGEGFVFPLLNRFFKNNNYSNEAALTGVLTLGIPLSSLVSGLILPALIRLFGWHGAYLFMGVLSAVMTFVLYFLCKQDISSERKTRSKRDSVFATMKIVFMNLNVIKSYMAIFCFGLVLMFYINWLPSMFMSTFHINLHQSGLFIILPWAASCVALLAGSYYLDKRSIKHGSIHLSFIKPLSISLLISAVCLVVASHTTGVLALVSVITVNLFAVMFSNSALLLTIRKALPGKVGTATGLMALFFLVACMSIGPLTGFILDITGSYNNVFLVMSVICLVSSIFIGYPVKKVDHNE